MGSLTIISLYFQQKTFCWGFHIKELKKKKKGKRNDEKIEKKILDEAN